MRRSLLSVLILLAIASSCHAFIINIISDGLERQAMPKEGEPNWEAVQQFREELSDFQKKIAELKENQIEKLLGKSIVRREKMYALPAAQSRVLITSGICVNGEMPTNRREFYPVGDGAGIEVWYGRGNFTEVVVVYLKVDEDYRKLPDDGLVERLAWDRERFTKLVKLVDERRSKK